MTFENKELKSNIEKETLIRVQRLARGLRNQSTKEANINYTKPLELEERLGHLNHQLVKRLLIRLRSTGCEWATKTGGCTICGFYGVTAKGENISEEEYIAQFNHVLREIDLNNYPIVCIYNDGNIFNENEVPISALEKIFKKLDKFKKVKKIVVESRMEYVTEDKIKRVLKNVNGKELEINFGFESSSEEIMTLCLNKGFSLNRFNYFYKLMRLFGVSIKPLLLLKPPFLTEGEAINDILSTVEYLFTRGITDIDLEVTTVQRNTVAHQLWMNNLYRPPWLWSIVDILLQCRNKYKDKLHFYISPRKYSIISVDQARNCRKCDKTLIECINLYNQNFDTTVFKGLECSCKDIWREAIQEKNILTIPERIINQLETIKRMTDNNQ